jgi:tRNA modification GTPase
MSHHEAERFTPIMCSATHGTGMDAVRSAILSKLIGRISSEPAAAISERHRSATVVARDAVHEAIHLVKCNPPDIAAACSSLRTAAETIGQITGRTYHDDLLSAIFSKFCVGK